MAYPMAYPMTYRWSIFFKTRLSIAVNLCKQRTLSFCHTFREFQRTEASSFRAEWVPVSVTCLNPCLLAMSEEFSDARCVKIRTCNQVCNTCAHSLYYNKYNYCIIDGSNDEKTCSPQFSIKIMFIKVKGMGRCTT